MAERQTSDALRLAELLAVRLCHELAGPAGALAGTLELAVEERDFDTVAMAHEQAALLAARLRLLRAAWGAGEALEAARLGALLAGLPRSGRVQVELDQVDPGARFPPLAARLLLNALLLAQEGLPRGGRIVVASAEAGIMVSLHGEAAGWPDLSSGTPLWANVGSRDLQAPLTALMARDAGIELTLTATGQMLIALGSR